MKISTTLLALAVAVSPATLCAQPAKIGQTLAAEFTLQTPGGRTLYVYDGDKVDLGQKGSSCSKQRAPSSPERKGEGAFASSSWSALVRPILSA